MKKLWLRLINIGIDDTTHEQEIMYVQVCNGLSVLVSLWMISLVPLILPYWPDSKVFAINGVVFPMLWPLILWMNHKKQYMLARIYLTVTSILIITINVLSVGGQTENHLFITMYIASALVVYPEIKQFAVVAAVGFVHFAVLEYWFSFNGPLVAADPAYYALIRSLSVLNIPVLFIIIALYHKMLLIKTQRGLREQRQAVRNLLDHAGQGFLTFDEKLAVHDEYSKECLQLFGHEIAGAKLVELLYPDDPGEQAVLEDILHSVFAVGDLQREVCLSLMPSELNLRGKQVQLQYKWIKAPASDAHHVMMVMTDISEKRQIEHHLETERKEMRAVVKVVKYARDFRELMAEYRAFAETGKHALLDKHTTSTDTLSELALIIHTFKGNFTQFDFVHLPQRLHELETQIGLWRSGPITSLRAWIDQLDLLTWLAEDLQMLHRYLGDHFAVEDDHIKVDPARLRQLEQRVFELYPGPEAKALVAELHRLRYCPFADLLSIYPPYVERLAQQTGKEVYPLTIEGGELLVDPGSFADFTRTLTHVFRNMMDHGIEMPEERIALGKDPKGTVGCRISATDAGIELKLFNDGAPIDLAMVRSRVLDMGLSTADQFDALPADEQRMFIVREGFTSKRAVTSLSGRGIGMSAVHKALQALQGTMRIDSDTESGTTFTFILPG